MLDDFPVEPRAQRVYRDLLRTAPVDEDAFLADLDDPDDGRRWLDRFADLGLVRTDPDGRLHADPPRDVIEAWASARELEAARARRAASVLTRLYTAEQGIGSGWVELVAGHHEVRRRVHDLQATARREVRALDRGAYRDEWPERPERVQRAALARGVRYRVLYEADLLAQEAVLRSLRESVAAGEQARVYADVPLRLLLSDTARGIVVLARPPARDADALIVYPSPLFDALEQVFEAFWRLGEPVPDRAADGPAEPSAETRRLLSLLAAGLTDEAIGRDLGVSDRTVHRRVSRLLELLGARTRFQLGLQAARRGWL